MKAKASLWVRSVLVVGLFLSGSSVWAQQKVLVGPCESASVDEQILSAICELMESEVEVQGYAVTTSAEEADLTLKASALKLGSSYTVTVSKIKGGKTANSSRLKASSENELDQVVPRLVRATLLGRDLRTDSRVGEMTEAEANFRAKRKESRTRHTYGFGFSSAPILNSGLMYDVLLGWGIDWSFFEFKVETDFAAATSGFSSFFGSLGGGGNFFFSDHETAPYLGFKVGFAVSKAAAGSIFDSTEAGPMGGLVLGVEGFRNHSATGFIQFKMEAQLGASELQSVPILWGLQGGVNF